MNLLTNFCFSFHWHFPPLISTNTFIPVFLFNFLYAFVMLTGSVSHSYYGRCWRFQLVTDVFSFRGRLCRGTIYFALSAVRTNNH